MRIALVINTLAVNGASLVTCNLARGLAQLGHEVLVLTLRQADLASAAANHLTILAHVPGIQIVEGTERSIRSPGGLARSFAAMRRALTAFAPDIVHAHTEIADIAVMLSGRGPHTATVRTIHWEHYFFHQLGAAGSLVEQALNGLHAFDGAVAISAATLERNRSAARLIPNGIFDLDSLPQRIRPRQDGGPVRVAVVGSLLRRKGQEGLIAAMRARHGTHAPFTLKLFGVGSQRSDLEALAAPLGDAVTFCGYESDRDRIYDGLDALLVVSRSEGVSTAMLEALARGVPVLSFPVSGAADVIGRWHCGRVLSGYDAVLDAIDRRDFPAVGESERLEIMAEYSLQRAAQRHEAYYAELLANRRAGR